MSSSILILNMLLLLFISAPSSFILLLHALHFPSYQQCAPYTCGNSTIHYPFGTCGPLNASCQSNNTVQIHFYGNDGRAFNGRVVGDLNESSYSSRTLQIAQDDIGNPAANYDWLTARSSSFNYAWLTPKGSEFYFSLSPEYTAGRVVNCTEDQNLYCRENSNSCFFYPDTDLQGCTSYPIILPNKGYNIQADPGFEVLKQKGFKITWSQIDEYCNSCQQTKGYCYYQRFYDQPDLNYDQPDLNYYQPDLDNYWYCICPKDEVHYGNCTDAFAVDQNGKQIIPGYTVGFIAIISTLCVVLSMVVVLLSCIMVLRQRRCKRAAINYEHNIRVFMDSLDSRPPSLENFLHYYKSQVPTRYSYSQIRSYTNNFADKVGKGGFGTVYKGKLPSGYLIAVKILDKSKQNEQQFVAEVATVGMTYHVNLVRLLGYCSQGSKRALVYEYMVNGSLDNYIHGTHQDELDWKQLHSIAVGTARGIAYLHGECRNLILHCDIKPHNVLVDTDFVPKVGDFGLAKISDRNDTHISAAQGGTLGYAAPEMWSRMYGPVTDKSDVYSYGMLLMEMVGGRKNFDDKESRSSKSYYPEWAFKQVQKGEFGNLRKKNMSEEDQSLAKRLSLVGLWCIQFNASHRPAMSKVIQMLEGGIDITIPPYPLPVDPPLQLSLFDESSSTYTSEVQMGNRTTMQTAKSYR